MEVHHPHHPTHKKKWNEYIIEFFMLFTAVTLGFFAENIREQRAEEEKAKELIEVVAKDLKADLAQMDMLRQFELDKIKQADSLRDIFNADLSTIDQQVYYRLLANFSVFYLFNSNDKSRIDAEAKGYFLKDENKQLAHYIKQYNFWMRDYNQLESIYMEQAKKFLFELLPEITDPEIFDKHWRYPFPPVENKIGVNPIGALTKRKTKYMLSNTKVIMDTYISDLDSMRVYANKAIELIEKH